MDNNSVVSMQTNKKSNKRRFSDEQVRSMELMFNSENRPGLKTKQQIADQLGLDPRQVAIWFQNRRARTKSKQTERDYSILKARYDNLASEFDALTKENQSLISEVQRLRGSKENPKDNTNDSTPAACSSNGESVSLSSAEKEIVWTEDYFQNNIFCEAKSEESNNYEQNMENHENFDVIEADDSILPSFRNRNSVEPMYLHCTSDWWEFWN